MSTDHEIDCEIVRCYWGWGYEQTPDNMKIELLHDEKTHTIFACLADIAEAMAVVRDRKDWSMFVGTGSKVNITPVSDGADELVKLELVGVFTVTQPALQWVYQLQKLMADAMSRHASKESDYSESESIVQLNNYLERQGLSPLSESDFEY